MSGLTPLAVPAPPRGRLLALMGLALVVASAAAAVVLAGGQETGPAAVPIAPETQAPETVARETETPLRQDTLAVRLGGGSGSTRDFLVEMKAGDGFAFGWATGGAAVRYELHAHGIGADGQPSAEQTLFEAGEAAAKDGYLIAPADGFYGWYFDGRGAAVAIEVRLAGFYALAD